MQSIAYKIKYFTANLVANKDYCATNINNQKYGNNIIRRLQEIRH